MCFYRRLPPFFDWIPDNALTEEARFRYDGKGPPADGVIPAEPAPYLIRGSAGIQITWTYYAACMQKQPCVYMLASQRNGTLYIGVTSDLIARVYQHKSECVDGFTKRYHVHNLVWYELHATMASAILREKQLKKWNRAWKMELIEKTNPHWRDRWAGHSQLWIPDRGRE